MSFRNKICSHLSDYRLAMLGIKEDGKFLYRGNYLNKAHILDTTHSNLNLITNYRDQFLILDKKNPIKRHRYFHHLNSSQALCLNLFYPLIAENKLAIFLKYLGIGLEGELTTIFEKESEIENTNRKTSFDFYVNNGQVAELFVEVKYTEDGFGKAKHDVEHIDKFHETYLPLLAKSSYLLPVCCEMEFFLNHYQILRNLIHISNDSTVIFLCPLGNTKVIKEAEYAREYCLNDAGKNNFRLIYLEDLVTFLEKQYEHQALGSFYKSFRQKYLPIF